MNKTLTDQQIEAAKEAGFYWHPIRKRLVVRHSSGAWVAVDEMLAHFATLLAAQQPEPIAHLTDDHRGKIERAEEQLRGRGPKDVEAANGLLDVLTAHAVQSEPRAEVPDGKRDAAPLIKTMSDIIHDQTVAMQSAIIEWRHGKGAEAGMSWIVNTLEGPGHLPDFDAPHGKHAQFWFNANQANPLPTCFCGNPSSSLWMGQGFCCDEHYRKARAKYDTARAGDAS